MVVPSAASIASGKRKTQARWRRHQGERDLGDAGAVMGVDHRVGDRGDGAVLGRQVRRASGTAARRRAANAAARHLDEMARAAATQRLAAARLGPVGRIGRRRLRLRAHRPRARRRAAGRGSRSRRPSARPDGDRACRSSSAPRRRCAAGDSSEQAPAVHARLALPGEAQDEIVARHVREAAEVDDVGEFRAAGGEALVAAGRDGERVADGDRPRRRAATGRARPRRPRRDAPSPRREPGIGAARPDELAAREPAVGKAPRAAAARPSAPSVRDDRAGRAEGGVVEVDAAARVAEIGVAGRAVEPAALLVEAVHDAAQLGGEGAVGAADLADRRRRRAAAARPGRPS